MALNNVPLPGQSLNVTRNPINQNFLVTNSGFLVDHVEFNIPNAGKHKKSTYLQQTFTLPNLAPATAADENVIFGRDSLQSPGSFGLFLQQANKLATDTPIEFGFANKTVLNGYTILPSGIWLQWGSDNLADHQQTKNIVFATPFPINILSCQVTPSTIPGGDIRDAIIISSVIDRTSFNVRRSNTYNGTAVSFNYLVIGY